MLMSAVFTVAFAVILTVLLRLLPRRHNVIFLIACWTPLVFDAGRVTWRALGLNGYTGHMRLSTTLQGLPLNMCGVAALILPVIAMKRERVILLMSFLYFFSFPGSIATLLLGNAAPKNPADPEFWIYYVTHSLYVVLPVALIVSGYVRPRIKDLLWVDVMVAGLVTVAHLLNLAVNAIFGPMTVNFINTLYPGDMIQATGQWSRFPIMSNLYDLTGGAQYWYLYLFLPLLAVLQGILVLPLLPGERARKRAALQTTSS